MYEGGKGGGVLPAATTTAGVLILPNTGGNIALMIVSSLFIAVGVLVVASTVARFIAKKAYNA